MHWFFSFGDAYFFFDSQLRQLSLLPQTFDPSLNFGFVTVSRLWLDYPIHLIVRLLAETGARWWIIDKLFWVVCILFGIGSSFALSSKFVGRKFAWVGSIVYVGNTYALLLFAGGQLGVALAYAVAPLVVRICTDNADRELSCGSLSEYRLYLTGIALTILVSCDIRLAALVCLVVIVYTVSTGWQGKTSVRSFATLVGKTIVVPGILAGLLHLFWILPTVLFPGAIAELGSEYTGVGMVKFLSFADFTHTLSLLHPNWPDNLFGKIYFFRTEFLVIPILAYAAVLMKRKPKDIQLPFFALVGLLGAFFAKGTNEPFGDIYTWLFQHVPGFVMYRDPTKFYVLTAISYMVLIPVTIKALIKYLHEKTGKVGVFFAGVVFLVYWGILVRPLFISDHRGNFFPQEIPADYYLFADMVRKDPVFSRSVWVPFLDIPSYADAIHPRLAMDEMYPSAPRSAQLAYINDGNFASRLAEDGIRYVVVPADLDKTHFLTDYRYNPKIRQTYVDALDKTGLTRLSDFKDLAVWERKNPKPLIGLEDDSNTEKTVSYKSDNSWKGGYVVDMPQTATGSLMVRFAYDRNWRLMDNKTVSFPEKTQNGFMRFPLIFPGGSRQVYLRYEPQVWSVIGCIVGFPIVFMVGMVLCIGWIRSRKVSM